MLACLLAPYLGIQQNKTTQKRERNKTPCRYHRPEAGGGKKPEKVQKRKACAYTTHNTIPHNRHNPSWMIARAKNHLNLTPPPAICPLAPKSGGIRGRTRKAARDTYLDNPTQHSQQTHTHTHRTNRQQQQRFHCTPAPEFPEMLCQPSPTSPQTKITVFDAKIKQK